MAGIETTAVNKPIARLCPETRGPTADFRPVLRATCGKIGLQKALRLEALLLRADQAITSAPQSAKIVHVVVNKIDNFADNSASGTSFGPTRLGSTASVSRSVCTCLVLISTANAILSRLPGAKFGTQTAAVALSSRVSALNLQVREVDSEDGRSGVQSLQY